ncbi:MAG: hypothetical protein EAZ37_05435 [Burkholderiales bacterium]|nr:MAG: hypothetical protein EAZ37_05435 [Burkholderiales bacterium]
MNSIPSFGASSELPNYLPLSGLSANQAHTVLLRKGGLLEPVLTRNEAQDIGFYMHLEHFSTDAMIYFQAQDSKKGRLMLILAGEASIRMRESSTASQTRYSPIDQSERWFTATEGATLGLVHAFAGLSSRFVAQATSELFVASLPREALCVMKKQAPALALRFMEMLSMELALVALDHERRLEAMNSVARSMQGHIDGESYETLPAPLI